MYILPEIVIYKDADFNGDEWRFNLPPGWGYTYIGDDWNDKISAVIVIAGTWLFCEHANFHGAQTIVGPGYYRWVEDQPFNMQNDSISSIKCLDDYPQGDKPVVDA